MSQIYPKCQERQLPDITRHVRVSNRCQDKKRITSSSFEVARSRKQRSNVGPSGYVFLAVGCRDRPCFDKIAELKPSTSPVT